MNLQSVKPKLSNRLRGIFAPSIPYEIRIPLGDWSVYFGTWEGQKKGDLDTNCCWAFAGNECLEDNLEFLWKTGQLSNDLKTWFQTNGYIDSDGDFYLSREFIPVLSGVQNNGNDQAEFWRLTNIYGAIPNAMLPFTSMDGYFDPNKITPAMKALGQEFLKRIYLPYQEVGRRFAAKDISLLKAALFQSELQIGIPVPHDVTVWNGGRVKWDGSTAAQHSVALYKIDEKTDPDFPYYIYDQYNPILKQLSKDYFIPIVTQAVVSPKVQVIPNPISQTTLGARIWEAIWVFFTQNPLWVGT